MANTGEIADVTSKEDLLAGRKRDGDRAVCDQVRWSCSGSRTKLVDDANHLGASLDSW